MRILPFLVLAPLLALAACAAPCGTATCQADAAVADWPSDPEGVAARVIAIPDELVRTVVIGRLADAYPGATARLCAALPAGPSRVRCERVNNRPHLSVVPGAAALGGASAAGDVPRASGSAAATLPEKPTTASFPEVRLPIPPPRKPDRDACADAVDRPACLDRAAVDALLAGDTGEADRVCARHAEARWADECRFNAAEEAVRARHGDAYAAAAALCGASSRFAQECWAHVASRLPRAIPPPDVGGPRARQAVRVAEDVARAWAGTSADAAEAHVARFWALYFANAYREAEDPDGTPLGVYPEAAWPHVRAAVAMRMRALGRLEGPYAAQLAALRAALARRDERAGGSGRGADLVFVPDLGAPATEGPTTYFLGAARRALGVDAAQDEAVCLIESAARADPPDTALLTEASEGADARVAAEARRLLAALSNRPP